MPFPRYGLETVFLNARSRLFLNGRVDTPSQQFFGVIARFPCFFEGQLGVCTKGKQFLAALKTVFHAPALGAAGRDVKKKAVAVEKLPGLVRWLYATDGGIGKGHGVLPPGR